MSMLQATDGRYFNPPAAFGHWFAGFTDGEGCFMAACRKNGTWELAFAFTMRADEEPIMREIQSYFGGGIYTFHKGINHSVTLRWGSAADCIKLQKLFTKYPLRAKKRQCFKLWSQLLAAKLIGIRATEVRDLVQELKDIKKYHEVTDVSTVPAVST